MKPYERVFDMRHPWIYIIISVLVSSLFALRLPHKDTMFICMNVVIYTAITSGIFYGYTKYEEKKITEKYIKNILGLLYDKDKDAYEEFLTFLRKEKNNVKGVSFVEKYSTLLVGCFFIFVSLVYYAIFRSKISLTSVGRNGYYLIILGLTELFITFFVMSRIPHQDVTNLMDTFIRSKEICSINNVKFLTDTENKVLKCVNKRFSENGDTCVADDTHYFVCDNGKIKRQRNF